jgi:NAD(P)-dependent dehydrogenase (short-subunit alcohol dehydrogenase family)
MKLQGRVAVVTGGGSGIGAAMAKRWLAEGMRVVIADHSQPRLDETARALGAGADLLALRADVSLADEVEQLAQRTVEKFGAVHLLCNNAGVGGEHGAAWEQSLASWNWVLGVNLWGAIHGVRSFVPRMLAGGEPSHVVNTSSISGLRGMPYTSGYSVSKYGIVALSEVLHQELRDRGAPIGVSVVCPGPVRTPILDPTRERPPGVAGPAAGDSAESAAQEKATRDILERIGAEPEDVADRVAEAVREDRFWVFTHPGSLEWVEVRHASLRDLLPPPLASLDTMPPRRR